MSIKALCVLWMTLAVVRPVSVSAQAAGQACSEDAAAGRGPGTGMLCVLFKQWLVSVQAWRSWGKEVAACLHSWIVLWAPPVSNALLFKHSQVWRWPPLMLVFTALPSPCLCSPSECVFVNSEDSWPRLSSLLWVFAALTWWLGWWIESIYRAQFLTLRHKGRATQEMYRRMKR